MNERLNPREPRAIRVIEDRWTTIRHVVEALAIIAAGVWAFYTFFYQEKLKPAAEPPALAPSISISRLGRDAGRDILKISVAYHNTGKTEIDLAADAVNLWGVRFASNDKPQRENGTGTRSYLLTVPVVSRRLIASITELRAAARGGRPGFQNVIEPGATTTISNVIALRRGQYDLIHAQIIAVPVKLHETGVRVDFVPEKGGGTFLRPDPARAFEDDNDADFALTQR
ncbi:MAG TPA: hypothetical protein VIG51_05140 [Candidatus Baltobacteraceae bacterium]|jgi:hypothetical protein